MLPFFDQSLQIPFFQGDPKDPLKLVNWFDRVESVRKLGNIPDDKMYLRARAFLGEKPLKVVKFAEDDSDKPLTMKELKNVLFSHYGDQKTAMEILIEITKLIQRPTESVDDFVIRCRVLFKKLKKKQSVVAESVLVDAFTGGLNPDIGIMVIRADPSTLAGAIKVAVREGKNDRRLPRKNTIPGTINLVEPSHTQNVDFYKSNIERNISKLQGDVRKIKNHLLSQKSKQYSKNDFKSELKCLFCNKRGHLEETCWTKFPQLRPKMYNRGSREFSEEKNQSTESQNSM
jgi:hypothetical protein